jgi:hypothetical protein
MMERSLIQDLRNCCPVNMDAVTSLLSSDVVKEWTHRITARDSTFTCVNIHL